MINRMYSVSSFDENIQNWLIYTYKITKTLAKALSYTKNNKEWLITSKFMPYEVRNNELIKFAILLRIPIEYTIKFNNNGSTFYKTKDGCIKIGLKVFDLINKLYNELCNNRTN